MPINLQWHSSFPVLMITYSGNFSLKEYHTMCAQRLSMLDEGPDNVIVLANTLQVKSFPNILYTQLCDSVLVHDKIRYILVVIPKDFYLRLSRTMLESEHTVRFFYDMDKALDTVKKLHENLT